MKLQSELQTNNLPNVSKIEDYKHAVLHHSKMKCQKLREIAFLKTNLSIDEYGKLARLEMEYNFHYSEQEKFRFLYRNQLQIK